MVLLSTRLDLRMILNYGDYMEESILTTIKNMLEIDLDDDCFDEELVTYINTCFIILKQVGAIDYDFYVIDRTTSWADLLKDKASSFQSLKTYVYARVKILFDPPSSSTLSSYENLIRELEFRLGMEN